MSISSSTFNPEGHPPFAPTYSHICVVPLQTTSKLISFAGQIGHDSTSGQTPSSFAEQVKVALDNVDKCLKAAGATVENIIQVRHYVVNMGAQSAANRQARADLYAKFMNGHKPPSTLIGVESLATAELLYEIEVLAVVNK